ncbi:GntR family transcriptional regulator [Caballeronia terrestris]|jgi:DNA-binding FadR family transcriptional regulator|uniref:GntR family transcriptional regulator n=1 Tax=Caballeronia terrestris TaxID=1226301 RepID=A0A158K9N0_9BURK|nr:FCD domain-containing protein [Caballeronia terrestris]SAL77735.1 GntR family transcriptional regulator [Caballeronia terrestris]
MNHGYEASLVKRVVNQLVTGIVNGEYAENLLPPQVILSKKYGVSRTIMREALSILISRRMLDVRPKTGTRIKPSKEWLIIDHEVAEWRLRATADPEYLRGLMEFRALVDPRAASLAAMRAGRQQRIAIAIAYQNLAHASANSADSCAAEDALLSAIADASGDELLKQMSSVVRMGMRARPAIHPHALACEVHLAHFAKVVRAIEASDAEGARAAMTLLLANAAERLMEAA